ERVAEHVHDFGVALGGLGDVDGLHAAAATFRRVEPRTLAAGMLLIADENFAAGLEVQAGGDVTHGGGDVLGEGNFGNAGVQQAGGFRADLRHGAVAGNPLVAGLVVPIGDVGGHFAQVVHGAIE